MVVVDSFNVVLFGGHRSIGAVNGMRPCGTVDSSCLQSREVIAVLCSAVFKERICEECYIWDVICTCVYIICIV